MFLSRCCRPLVLILALLAGTSVKMYGALSGTYTIDPGKAASSRNYQNIYSTIRDLLGQARTDGGTSNGNGVKGSVIFNIADGTYEENIGLFAISGVSAINTITYQSASSDSSKVIIYNSSGSSDFVTLDLKSNYFIFRNMTLNRTESGVVLNIINNASNITFQNMVISSADNANPLVSLDCNKKRNLNFINTLFINGSYGITTCNAGSIVNHNITISNSIFKNVPLPFNLSHCDSLKISGNSIYQSNGNTGGISITNCNQPILIKRNTINLQNLNSDYIGINLVKCYGNPENRCIVANNTVYIKNSSSNYIQGLHRETTLYLDLVYNTVLIDNVTTGTAYPLYVVEDGESESSRILNNDLVNPSGSCAIYYTGSFFTDDSIDYNNLVSNDALVRWDTKSYNSLSSYKAAMPFDQHSVSIMPTFIGNGDLHNKTYVLDGLAHPISTVTDDMDGEPRDKLIPDIGADENNFAHEIKMLKILSPNPTICPGITYQIMGALLNHGTNVEGDFTIKADITGPASQNFSFLQQASIAAGKTDTFFLAYNLTFTIPGTYKLKMYHLLKLDQNPYNDTLTQTINVLQVPTPSFGFTDACIKAPVLFNNTTANSTSNTTYAWDLGNGAKSALKNPTASYVSSSPFKVLLTVTESGLCKDTFSAYVTPYPFPNAAFTYTASGYDMSFAPLDATGKSYLWRFGDGTTSTLVKPFHQYLFFGNYNYIVTLVVTSQNGCVDSIRRIINLGQSGIHNSSNPMASWAVYPNPFSNQTTVAYTLSEPTQVQLAIYDMQGRMIKQILNAHQEPGQYTTNIDAANAGLVPGIYFLKIGYDGYAETKKLVLMK